MKNQINPPENSTIQASSVQNQLTIQRNGYTGYLKVIDYGNASTLVESFGGQADVRVTLGNLPTRIGVETGANLGGSAIDFNVKSDGTVDRASIIPQEAVLSNKGVLGALVLNTKPVTIDPGKYTGTYYISALRDLVNPQHPVIRLKGKYPPFQLVAGLLFSIDNGTHYPIIDSTFCESELCEPKKGFQILSDFSFKVLADGSLQTGNSIASSVSTNILHFKSAEVTIDPAQISEGSPITCQEETIPTKTVLYFLPSLLTRLYWQANGCRRNQFFVPM